MPDDGFRWRAHATLRKWRSTASYQLGCLPDEQFELPGNMLLNAGIQRFIDLLLGAGGQALDSTHCRVGVGSSSTAAAAGQTDLQGGSKYFKLCDSVARSSETFTVVGTFGSTQANFAWEEWGVDFGVADGTTVTAPLLNRKVVSMGTKVSGSTWQLTVSVTIS